MDPKLPWQIIRDAELRAEARANTVKIRDLQQRAQAANDKSTAIHVELSKAEMELDRLLEANPSLN